jgi:hypothetical protein
VQLFRYDPYAPLEGVGVAVFWGPSQEYSLRKETDVYGEAVFTEFGGWEGDVLVRMNYPRSPFAGSDEYYDQTTQVQRGTTSRLSHALNVDTAASPVFTSDLTLLQLSLALAAAGAVGYLAVRRRMARQ